MARKAKAEARAQKEDELHRAQVARSAKVAEAKAAEAKAASIRRGRALLAAAQAAPVRRPPPVAGPATGAATLARPAPAPVRPPSSGAGAALYALAEAAAGQLKGSRAQCVLWERYMRELGPQVSARRLGLFVSGFAARLGGSSKSLRPVIGQIRREHALRRAGPWLDAAGEVALEKIVRQLEVLDETGELSQDAVCMQNLLDMLDLLDLRKPEDLMWAAILFTMYDGALRPGELFRDTLTRKEGEPPHTRRGDVALVLADNRRGGVPTRPRQGGYRPAQRPVAPSSFQKLARLSLIGNHWNVLCAARHAHGHYCEPPEVKKIGAERKKRLNFSRPLDQNGVALRLEVI